MTTRIPVLLFAIAWLGCVASGPEGHGLLPKAYDGALVVTPSPVEIPETRVGCVRSASLRLTNGSPGLPVAVTDVVLPDPALRLGEPLPITLAPGEGRAVALHFMPDGAGRRSGTLEIVTDEGTLHPLRVPVSAESREPATPPVAAAPPGPLDLVFVLDVSTTMDELAALRGALQAAFDFVEGGGLDVRFALTTFENDVRVHRQGRFLPREAFFEELDSQLVAGTWTPDPERPRQLLNYDFPENALDALARSAEEADFRDGARRYLLLMTDDTFLEAPAVFSDGTPAVHGFAETSETQRAHGVVLFSVHAPLRGRGLSSPFDGSPSLVSSTGGAWFEIAGIERGSLHLEALLLDLITGHTCAADR